MIFTVETNCSVNLNYTNHNEDFSLIFAIIKKSVKISYLNSFNRDFGLSEESQCHGEEDISGQLQQVEVLDEGESDFCSDFSTHDHEGDHGWVEDKPLSEHAESERESFDHRRAHYEVNFRSKINIS